MEQQGKKLIIFTVLMVWSKIMKTKIRKFEGLCKK